MKRDYLPFISLTKNSRGIYSIDPSIGCSSGMSFGDNGCYGDCYAAKSARLYGYDFSKTVFRTFKDKRHEKRIIHEINRVKLDFVRMGTSGDPSENWEHTFNILEVISKSNKEIVIITKHWYTIPDKFLYILKTINISINSSVSALDTPEQVDKVLNEYYRLKPFCRSFLRVVSCDFNLTNKEGARLAAIQNDLLKNEDVIDTVFRVSPKNEYVKNGIINIKQANFLGKKIYVSKFNKKTYLGKCDTCLEMCGVRMSNESYTYPDKRFIPKQLELF